MTTCADSLSHPSSSRKVSLPSQRIAGQSWATLPFIQSVCHQLDTLLAAANETTTANANANTSTKLKQTGLKQQREKAFEQFVALGLPSRKQEDWKTIPVHLLFRHPLVFSMAQDPQALLALTTEALSHHQWIEDDDEEAANTSSPKARLVFMDGLYQASLSSAIDEAGILVCSIQELPGKPSGQEKLEALLEQFHCQTPMDAMDALAQSLFTEGFVVLIPEKTTFEPLIEILYLTSQGSAQNLDNQPDTVPTLNTTVHRQWIVLGNQAQASISIQQINLHPAVSSGQQLQWVSRQVMLNADSQLTMTVLSRNHASEWQLQTTQNCLKANAVLNMTTMTTALTTTENTKVRHAIRNNLLEEGASVSINGLDILNGKGRVFHPTQTHHVSGNTQSDQLYKSILHGQTESEFNGTVFVAKGANGTRAEQMNRSLLLSDQAKVWTRPQLQILAHDVKCTHGATVGQLEADQLFYLSSRGLDRSVAEKLLIYGFAEDVLQVLKPEALRNALQTAIREALQPSVPGS
jgi:Fe-S cluster assembly protein SufD